MFALPTTPHPTFHVSDFSERYAVVDLSMGWRRTCYNHEADLPSCSFFLKVTTFHRRRMQLHSTKKGKPPEAYSS